MPSEAETFLSEDSEPPNSDKFSIPVSDCLAFCVYSSTKPHNLKIAGLQKGAILTCNNLERVGEGTGFGFPVLVCPKETIFSGSATVRLSEISESFVVVKEFNMDRRGRNKLRNVQLKNRQARAFVRCLSDLYQKNKHFRFLHLKELILNMGVEAEFEEIEPIGKISVTYEMVDNEIKVQVDLNRIEKKHLKRVFILNEQSATFFRRYQDSQGTALVDGEIGAWDIVKASCAWFMDMQGRYGFKLWQADGAVLRRGRETMRNCLDWVGLDYEVDPKNDFFEYRIELLGAK